MKNRDLNIVVLLLLALFLGVAWGLGRDHDGRRYPDYSSFSTNEYGVALLYDTLQHMGFVVRRLHTSVNINLSSNDVIFIIQPRNPAVSPVMAEEILDWVRMGGRLVFLSNNSSNALERALYPRYYRDFGSMRWYQYGSGEIIAGRADLLANINLMNDPIYGEGFSYILLDWSPDRIYFAEFYHGFGAGTGGFQQLPLYLQLIIIQVVLVAAAFAWHFGKRFGRPVPLYEEIERDENEEIKVLARLYRYADKKK